MKTKSITPILGVGVRMLKAVALAASMMGGYALTASGHAQVVQDLGALDALTSEATVLSSDGSTVVGACANHAFRWTVSGGTQDLGTLGGERSSPNAVSANGAVIVGSSDSADGSSHAFRWSQDSGMQDIFPTGVGAVASLCSSDGSVVVGSTLDAFGNAQAFRWTAGGGAVQIAAPDDVASFVSGISTDGTVLAGGVYRNGAWRPFRWSVAGGLQVLPALLGDSGSVFLSGDGSVLAGSRFTAGGFYVCWRWSSALGLQDLPTISGAHMRPSGLSADGSTIVGDVQVGVNNRHILRWRLAGGFQDLGGSPDDTMISWPHANADGFVILASSQLRTYRWTSSTGWQQVGTFGTDDMVFGTSLSADGNSVAGTARTPLLNAFHWDATAGVRIVGRFAGNSGATIASDNGSVIAGWTGRDADHGHAFRWTSGGGMVDLGAIGGGFSIPAAMSSDGSVIVGESRSPSTGWPTAFRWSLTGGMAPIMNDPAVYSSSASAVSSDGSVVAGGYVANFGGASLAHCFRWDPMDGAVDLGTLGYEAVLGGMSSDGRTIVGYSATLDGVMRGFRWSVDAGMVELPVPAGETGDSQALAVSADGGVIAGTVVSAIDGGLRGARWSSSGVESLGDLGGGYSSPQRISGDGSTIVGTAIDSSGVFVPFIWRAVGGMVALPVPSQNIDYVDFLAISHDGSEIFAEWLDADTNATHRCTWTAAGVYQELTGPLGTSRVRAVSRNGKTFGGAALQANGFVHAVRISLAPTVALGHATPTTCGLSNGAIDITSAGATSFSWTGPGGFTSASQNLANIAAGNYAVTATGPGGSATLTVTVGATSDTAAPVISSIATSMTAAASASCTATVPNFIPTVVASDNCSIASITQSPAAGSSIGLGSHPITVVVRDAAGNEAAVYPDFIVTGSSAMYYADNDSDGYGYGAGSASCAPVAGKVTNNTDCNDSNGAVHPGAIELCGDGLDNNCSGQVDEGCAPFTVFMAGPASPPVPGNPFIVRVSCNAAGSMLTGEQLAVHFDAARLALADVVPVAGSPFTLEIAKQIDNTAGTLRYAAGIPGSGQGLSQAAGLVDLVFTVRAGATMCGDAVLATFEPVGAFATRFTRSNASPLVPVASNLASMHLDTTAPVLAGVPGDVDVPTDAGSTYGAFVSLPTVTATDECDGAVAVIATGIPSNGIFPIGTTTVTWSATDDAGNTASVSRTVTVLNHQLLDAHISLNGFLLAAATRSIRVTAGASASVHSVTVPAGIDGVGAIAGIQVPVAASYPCVAAKDTVHSLTRTASASVVGTRYDASFALVQGDSNDDDLVEIVDYATFILDIGAGKARDARSNFNADTMVNNADFSHIGMNFFTVGESCTPGAQAPTPRERISVKELRRIGRGELAAADLNHDGWVDMRDIQIFMQGGGGAVPVPEDAPRGSGDSAS